MPPPLKVIIACAGLGRVRRGFESFADECFDALRRSVHLAPTLIHGPSTVSRPDEFAVPYLPRHHPLARAYGLMRARGDRARGRYEALMAEQASFGLGVARHAARTGTDVILFSEAEMGPVLRIVRQWFGLRYRTVFSNGGPWSPPFPFCDHIQQLTPYHLDLALRAGVPTERQSQVPYGFAMPDPADGDRTTLRIALDLPTDRPVVLSVAAINHSHKRLDYLIDEAAALGVERPFFLFLGQTDAESSEIKKQASARLGERDHRFASVSNTAVGPYYRASDLFVLSSISEAFGRVLVEALSHGLPCLVHDYPITRYVLGDLGRYADFSRPGALTDLLRCSLGDLPALSQLAAARREAARARFGWESLLPAYEQMFFTVANRLLPG